MTSAANQNAWHDFWVTENSHSGGSVVSHGESPISHAQFEAWVHVAERISDDARVLDVATGGGKLARMLRARRPDIEVVGVDRADPPDNVFDGIELIGGVSMEALPFVDGEFDAVVSQFGFEYGEPHATAAEILRVAKPGAPIGLMVHRGDGPILEQNRLRCEQIKWAKDENAILNRVTEMLEKEKDGIAEALVFTDHLTREGGRRYGSDSPAWEIPEAIRRSLIIGSNGPREKIIETVAYIIRHAEDEVSRIATLENACKLADNRAVLLSGFEKAGRQLWKTIPVNLSGDGPFADLIIL